MKRISILFAFLLAVLGSFAQAGDVLIVEIEGLAYEIDFATKTALVDLNSDWGPDGEPVGGVSGAFKIPKHISYDGTKYKVVGLKRLAFFNCYGLTSIEIPSTVTCISNEAFRGTGLTTIEIPKSVTSIGEGAFELCSSLTSIEIPKSVTSIGDDAFQHCERLTSVVIPKSVTSIGERAFGYCDSLTSIVVPRSVTSIGKDAFYHSGIVSLVVDDRNLNYCAVDNVLFNKEMTELIYCPASKTGSYDVPSTVTKIAAGAFADCEALTSVNIPSSVVSIESSAFSDCDGIRKMVIPESVASIADRAFSGCSSLETVSLPSSLKTIGEYAFARCTVLESVEIPAGITNINTGLFEECSSLTSAKIPDTVIEIGDDAFANNFSLRSVDIPSSVKRIASTAFKDCGALTKVTIDAPRIMAQNFAAGHPLSETFGDQVEEYVIAGSVDKIGENAFRGCKNLTAVTLPAALESIEPRTFKGCTGLSSIVLPDGLKSIGDGAFDGCTGLTSIALPTALTTIGNEAFSCCTGLTSVEIPAAVRSIGQCAFSECSALKTATLPQGLQTLGKRVFAHCRSLTSVPIPETLTRIDDEAFTHCTRLTTVALPSSVTHIGASAFEECRSLASLALPASLTSIGDYAFNGCNSLSAVDIPASVSSVGHMAFPLHIYKNSRSVITRNFFGLTLGVSTKQEAISTLLEKRVKLVGNAKNYLMAEDLNFDGNHYDAVYFNFYKGILQQIGFSDSGNSGFSSSKRAMLSKQYTNQYGPYKNYFFESEGGLFTDDVTRLLITESTLFFVDEALSKQSSKDDAARFREIRPFAATRISKSVLDCTLGVSTKDEVVAAFAAKGMSVVQEALPDSIVFSGVTHEGVDFKAVTAKFFAGKLMELDFSNLAKPLPNSDFDALKETFQQRYAAYDMSIGLDGIDVDHAAYSDDAVTLSINRKNGLFYQDAELGNQYFESLIGSLRGKRQIDPDKQHFVDLFLQVSKSGK